MKKEKILNIKFILMAIICICIFTVGIVGRGLQNDTFYTIKLGKLILENGIDMKEHFAWHEGLPYTYPHWLYDVGMYLIFNKFGFEGIYISSIVLGAILGITIYLTNAKRTKNVIIPFVTTVFIMFVGKGFITARAQLVTFILFVLTIYFIEQFLDTKKIKYAFGLLIISTIIANVHAAVFPFYFILYLPYIGEYFMKKIIEFSPISKFLLKIDEINIKMIKRKENPKEEKLIELEKIEKRFNRNKEKLSNKKISETYKIYFSDNKNTKWLLLIFAIAAFTGLLTPIGNTPYTYLINTMKGTTTGNISEHLPIVLYKAKYILFLIAFAIGLVTFSRVKIKLSDLFLLGGLIFLTIMSTRQQSMLIFVGIIVINRLICQLIEIYDDGEMYDILKCSTMLIFRILIYSLFVIILISQIKNMKKEEIVSEKDYPIKATEYIIENLDTNKIRLFNEYNFGSYLLYKDIPVFIDSRADVYDPAFNGWEDDIFRDFINISDGKDYEEKFEHYGITHLLIYKNSTLGKILVKDEKYKELFSDSNFVLYERQK